MSIYKLREHWGGHIRNPQNTYLWHCAPYAQSSQHFQKTEPVLYLKAPLIINSSILALGRWEEFPPDLPSIVMLYCEMKGARWLCHPRDSWYTIPSSVWLHLPHTWLLFGTRSSSWTFDNVRTKEPWDSAGKEKSVWTHLPATFSELQGNVDLHHTIL